MFKPALSLVACATLVASLGAQTLSIEPIVVTSNKTEQTIGATTSPMEIITARDLEEKRITSVIDALKLLSSVPITQYGGIGQNSSFFLRGLSSENTVILIDGIRYNDPTTTKGQAQLEHLSVQDIERIEILKGAQSGVWGANAVAGVINIITKQPSEHLAITGAFEYGSYASTKASASLSQKRGNLSYYLGATQIKTDGISSQTPRGKDPEHYENDGYKNRTVNGKLAYSLTSADTLDAQFTYIDALSQYDGFGNPDSYPNEIRQINRLATLGYAHAFTGDTLFKARYSSSRFEKNDPLGWTSRYKGSNKELAVQLESAYAPQSLMVIGAGKLDTKDLLSGNELDSKGIFVSNTNRFGDLVLNETLRRDDYDSFEDKTTGKIGFKYFVTEDLVVSGNYGTAYRTPSLFEMYADYYGNPNLKPETTESYDISVGYQGFTFTYYTYTVDNLIGFDPVTYINEQVEGKSRFKGYEASYETGAGEWFTLQASYNRLFAANQDQKHLQRRPHDSFRVSLDFYGIRDLHLGVSGHYVGTRYDNLAQTVQTGRYTLWNAVANYDLNPRVAFYVKGENLTDKRYQEVDGYGTAGRTVYAGLTTRF